MIIEHYVHDQLQTNRAWWRQFGVWYMYYIATLYKYQAHKTKHVLEW